MRRLSFLLLVLIALAATACAGLPALTAMPTRAQLALPLAPASPTTSPPMSIAAAPTPLVQPSPTSTPTIAPAETATAEPPAPPPGTELPTATPTEPSPTPSPHPLAGVTLAGLRGRDYPGGPVEIRQTLETAATYTRYYIAYPSDGLTITGIMQVPPGDGPFPVIILNHGYHDRESYWSGSGTWMAAEYLNGRGYLTIAPDYRTWGGSGWGPSLFHTGLVADVLNLIGSLATIPQADPARVGMWGHSMGGGITTKVLAVDPRVRAAVLYASNSADDADLIARWGRGCLSGETQFTAVCNPGEVIPADLPPEIVAAYVAAAADPAMLQQIAPIYALDAITAPVQIHIGTADGAEHNATPPEWSYKLHDALLAAGKQSELFVYEGQGHLFAGSAWTDMIGRAADFFDAHVR
jgi:dienelactone hydrolase